eukprot:TRINITY_DN4095_c0_g1_i2.p1 TRINITY_DN4095_c0_g1~~TRINITY_DN4095_c0_g1_i2.p1  ORF type:complete len:246 (-),score=71.13 TRINITY_DN4095_c0_g1_i2:144-881(-)
MFDLGVIEEEPNSGVRKPRSVSGDSPDGKTAAKSGAKSSANQSTPNGNGADAKANGKSTGGNPTQGSSSVSQKTSAEGFASKTQGKEDPSPKVAIRSEVVVNAVRLNNNQLQSWSGLKRAMSEILVDALTNLTWLDLSFNNFVDIDEGILEFTNLRNIHLHCNKISSFAQVEKLGALTHLHSITLHGNPLEQNKQYKTMSIAYIPGLKQLDFSPITKMDRETAMLWKSRHIKKKVEEPMMAYDES